MELSIEQLADLKIAINKSSADLKDITSKATEQNGLYNHAKQEYERLSKEAEEQAKIKEQLIKDNEELIKEKDVINGEYEKRNVENYNKIREATVKLEKDTSFLSLSLVEIEKREGKLYDQKVEVDNMIIENKRIKEDIGLERVLIEKILNDDKKVKDEIIELIETKRLLILESDKKIEEFEKEKIKVQEKEKKSNEILSKNNSTLLEINAKERLVSKLREEIDRVLPFLKEVKDFVAEHGTVTQNDVDKINDIVDNINNIDKVTADKKIVENNDIKTPVSDVLPIDYTNFSFTELKDIATSKGIKFSPVGTSKIQLIELLGQ